MRVPGTLAFALATALLAFSSSHAEVNIVEDWAQHAVGATGVPSGWRTYETFGGRPAYDFSVTEDEGRRALHLKSRNEHSTIAKEIRVSLRSTPILEWSWKVVQHPAGADLRRRETSDLTGHIFVVWPRFPGPLRSRLLGYAWDATLPAGAMERSRKTGSVMFVIVRSGTRELSRWVTERRNVYEDYRKAFGGGPGGSYRLHDWYGRGLAAVAASSQVARSTPLRLTVLYPWNILALRDDSRVVALGEGGVGNMPATRQ